MSRRRGSIAVAVDLAFVALLVAASVVTGFGGLIVYAVPTEPAGDGYGLDSLYVLEPPGADGATVPPPGSGGNPGAERRFVAGLEAIGATELHERGVTGEGVKVGVIGSGFDPRHPSIAGNVAARDRIDADASDAADETAHDTAVAEIVSRTAPGADLYLVEIGTEPTPERYAAAIEWLLANDVDVIVDSGSYFPPTMEGMDRITDAADNASAQGVVFVTSAGNYAERHWAGTDAGEGWASFASGIEANPLAGGDPVRGRVSLRLYWNSSADYDLYLYRHVRGGEDPVVAKSTRRQSRNDSLPASEAIDAAVPKGTYYVAVYARAGAANDTHTHLRLFSTRHSLGYATPEGSLVAPATSDRVIAVGAFDADGGATRAYSSRGASAGEVDVGAPDGVETAVAGRFYGTSAAAPFVAGTAALMEASAGDLSPEETRRILHETARASDGAKRIDALAAVEAASGAVRRPAEAYDATSDGNGTAASTAASDGNETTASTAASDESETAGANADANTADGAPENESARDSAKTTAERRASAGESAAPEHGTGCDGTAASG
ncbi:S8 family serine peptidase [Halegenticoccus soli]|uniref:S8 family serine peptidase n=1 Tax=Halegenticoccus soli TaxID=1985678 RepID=UPI000C6D8F72|nr:S8 family serine peptidase [Halegenticoccus soli]